MPKAPPVGGAFARTTRELVERVATGAGAAGVRVVDGETLLLDRVDEVDGRACEVGLAHLVDDDVDAAEAVDGVAVDGAVIEVELVAKTRAATGLDRYPQREVGATFLFEQGLHLRRGLVGEHDPGDASLRVTGPVSGRVVVSF